MSCFAGLFYRLPPCIVRGGFSRSLLRPSGWSRASLWSCRPAGLALYVRSAPRATLPVLRAHSCPPSAASSLRSSAPPLLSASRAHCSTLAVLGLPYTPFRLRLHFDTPAPDRRGGRFIWEPSLRHLTSKASAQTRINDCVLSGALPPQTPTRSHQRGDGVFHGVSATYGVAFSVLRTRFLALGLRPWG